MLDKVKISKAVLHLLNETDLVIYAHQVINLAKENISELAAFTSSNEVITALDRELNAFVLKRSERKMILEEKKNASAGFKATKRAINLMLKNELDWNIESYRAE